MLVRLYHISMLWISRILSCLGGPPLQLPPFAQLFLRDVVSTMSNHHQQPLYLPNHASRHFRYILAQLPNILPIHVELGHALQPVESILVEASAHVLRSCRVECRFDSSGGGLLIGEEDLVLESRADLDICLLLVGMVEEEALPLLASPQSEVQ